MFLAHAALAGAPTDPADIRLDVYPTLDGQIVPGLTRDDFEVVEDGAPQTIESVVYTAGGAAKRDRIFALFIDTYHAKADRLRQFLPLVARQLEPLIGPDDRVAILTPETSGGDVAPGPRPARLESRLLEAAQGRRVPSQEFSPDEKAYLACFEDAVALEMIARRRQKIALDSLQDLVARLRGAADGRKAVLVVSDGWNLFAAAPRRLPPKEGRRGNLSMNECDRDRVLLGQIDHKTVFHEILGEANHAGVTFYPLAAGGTVPAGALRTLGEATDGAVVDVNDGASLKRLADDLTAYYVIGYRSTNPKADGKERKVRVRVKRPGVAVRARTGYRPPVPAAERGESAASRSPALPADLERAFQDLEGVRRDARFHVRAAPASAADDGSASAWIVGELDPAAARSAEWSKGGDVEIALLTSEGKTLVSNRSAIEPGARTLMTKVTIPPASDFDGTARVRVTVRPAAGGKPATDAARIAWPDEPGATPAVLLFRRGPVTAQQFEPAADLRFRRSEQVRIQLPHDGAEAKASGRVVNRAGQQTQVPILITSKREADASWIVAELALAPLTPGDYAVELTVGDGKLLVPLRIIP